MSPLPLLLHLLLACGGEPAAAPVEVPPAVQVQPVYVPTAAPPVLAPTPDADGGGFVGGRGPLQVQPAQVSRSGGWAHYGTTFALPAAQALRCEALLADPSPHLGQAVRVLGRVAEVCRQPGCWLIVVPREGDGGELWVTMRDPAVAVAPEAAGRNTELEGMLVPAAQGEAATGAPYALVASVVRVQNP